MVDNVDWRISSLFRCFLSDYCRMEWCCRWVAIAAYFRWCRICRRCRIAYLILKLSYRYRFFLTSDFCSGDSLCRFLLTSDCCCYRSCLLLTYRTELLAESLLSDGPESIYVGLLDSCAFIFVAHYFHGGCSTSVIRSTTSTQWILMFCLGRCSYSIAGIAAKNERDFRCKFDGFSSETK